MTKRGARRTRIRIDDLHPYSFVRVIISQCRALLCLVASKTNVKHERQTDRQTDGPAVISAPGQISINNVIYVIIYDTVFNKPLPFVAVLLTPSYPIRASISPDRDDGSKNFRRPKGKLADNHTLNWMR